MNLSVCRGVSIFHFDLKLYSFAQKIVSKKIKWLCFWHIFTFTVLSRTRSLYIKEILMCCIADFLSIFLFIRSLSVYMFVWLAIWLSCCLFFCLSFLASLLWTSCPCSLKYDRAAGLFLYESNLHDPWFRILAEVKTEFAGSLDTRNNSIS